MPCEGSCDVQLVVCMGECTQTYMFGFVMGGGMFVVGACPFFLATLQRFVFVKRC